MNIRIAQINPIVGDIDGNSELIYKTIISSPDNSIVVFPELAITGYPPQDLLLDPKNLCPKKSCYYRFTQVL